MRLSWRVINMLVVFAVLTAVDILRYGPGGKTGWDIPGILVVTILMLVYEYKSDH
jgi:hypothetical protein